MHTFKKVLIKTCKRKTVNLSFMRICILYFMCETSLKANVATVQGKDRNET